MVKPFSLGMLSSFSPPAWHAAEDRLYGDDWWTGRHFVKLAQRLEAAGFDYLFFLDTLAVRRGNEGSMDDALRYAVTAPTHDPLPLLGMIAGATERIGLVGTASTSFYAPYQVARLFSTLDSMTGGRIGWNIVNSFEQAEAQNFGLDQLPEHGDRYDRAEEFVEAARALWEGWQEGALLRDQGTNTYVDPAKVSSTDYAGRFHRVRGPLNVLRAPQGTPVLVQAGASDRGRAFAAKNAELTFVPTDGGSHEALRATRADIRARAEAFGRDPDRVSVVYPVNIFFTEGSWNVGDEIPASDFQVKAAVLWLSQSLDLDLTQFPLDEPFPLDVPPSGIRSMFEGLRQMSRDGMTLRQAVLATRYSAGDLNFFGTPEQVGQRILDLMAAVGGDGVMIAGTMQFTAADLDRITERLVPFLREAGALKPVADQPVTLRERLFGAGQRDYR